MLAVRRVLLIEQAQALMALFSAQNNIHNQHSNDRGTTGFPRVYSRQVCMQLLHRAAENEVMVQGPFNLAASMQDRAVIPAAEVRTDLLQGQRR